MVVDGEAPLGLNGETLVKWEVVLQMFPSKSDYYGIWYVFSFLKFLMQVFIPWHYFEPYDERFLLRDHE